VQAMSTTTGGWLFLESGLEHELATWLDRQREVTWLVGQPVLLRWEDGTKHFPDMLSAHRDGSVTIWDVRAPEERDDTFLVMSTRTRAACEKVGWRYELFGGLEPADDDCVRRQARQDNADAGGTVGTFAGELVASEFTSTLRSLTALLLHLAAATRTPHYLPSWARDVAGAGTTNVRRWSIRPPQDPLLRSRALAADHILAADNIDTAATRFEYWLEHIPDVPEGRLGWLADHTRMTPTLTRLVMAAHAPRRRLSHLLDQTPPLTASTRLIPQVLPARLIDEYLSVSAYDLTCRSGYGLTCRSVLASRPLLAR
jgi:hypothetical protein